MATQSCTVIGQSYGSSISYSTGATANAGFNYNNVYYPYILKFAAPAFIGVASALVFNLSICQGKRNGANSTAVSLRYSICKSDANYSRYDKTTAAVSDANQIATGTINLTGLTSSYTAKAISIPTTGLESDTTYYLILWGDDTGDYSQDYCYIGPAKDHTVSLDFNQGLVYIDNGTSWDAYEVYIDNGTSWDKYIPYIDDGTSWNLCG